MNLPISVVLTCYKDRGPLWRALASVRSQMRAPSEIIVVEEDAHPDCVSIAREFGARVIPSEGRLHSVARNLGIASATHEWIALLNGSVLWDPRKLERQWEAVTLCPEAALILTDYATFNADPGHVPKTGWPRTDCELGAGPIKARQLADTIFLCDGEGLARRLVRADLIRHPSALLKRSAWEAVGGYDTALSGLEDVEFLLRVIACAPVVLVDEVLTQIVDDSGGVEHLYVAGSFLPSIASRVKRAPQRYPSVRVPARPILAAMRTLTTTGSSDLAFSVLRAGGQESSAPGVTFRALVRLGESEAGQRAARVLRRVANGVAWRRRRLLRKVSRALSRTAPRDTDKGPSPVVIAHETLACEELRAEAVQSARWAALTFDDGPDPELTPVLLQALQRLDVRATFFMVGWKARSNPSLCRDLTAAGMELANHSMTHAALTSLPTALQEREIVAARRAIEEAGGTAVFSFRPPYGAVDDESARLAARARQTIVMWNVSTEDWGDDDATRIARRTIAKARSASIILLHERRRPTIEALPSIVEAYRSAGFTFLTVAELLERLSPAEIEAAVPVAIPLP